MNTPTHFSILGRQPELGLIELESILGHGIVQPFGQHALIASMPPALDRLGGSLKLGRILARHQTMSPDELIAALEFDELLPESGKVTYGLSWYGPGVSPRQLTELGLTLKKRFRAAGRSARLIQAKPGERVLNAAQHIHNELSSGGFELVVIVNSNEMVVGVVESVQDIDAYTARDYDRPARSATVGMLPPKLAQILINMTHGTTLHDPFCGTGVILQEGLLMGRSVSGSDLATDMVDATTTNLAWLGTIAAFDHHHIGSVTTAEAQTVTLPQGVTTVVSEGYLGPNLTKAPNDAVLAKLIRQLLPLYRDTLANFAKQLASGAEIAICAPAWHIDKRWIPLPIVDEAVKLGYTTKVFETVPSSDMKPLIYGRDNQIVGRALILLTKV